MDLFEQIDIYCERTSSAFWAEPANFWSNLSFIVAGALAWLVYRKIPLERKSRGIDFLCVLAIVVGIGSGLFHSFATRWAMIADVLPIGLFLLASLSLFLYRYLSFSKIKTAVGVGCFLVGSLLISFLVPKELVNGSNFYFGTAFALGTSAWSVRNIDQSAYSALLMATFSFVVALFFRSIDLRVCSEFPMGTHFLWHTFAGSVVLFDLIALIYLEKSVANSP